MSKKKLVTLAAIFIIISVFSFYYAFKTPKVVIDFSDSAYSYLPESAKSIIEEEAKKGHKILTEKNKEPNKIYLNPKYVEYLKLSDVERKNYDVIPQMYTYDFVSVKTASANYPSSYRLENLTIKDQSTLGICWAFATISSIETNILATGLSSNIVNFSERQLDYAMADSITEISNPYSMTEIKNNTSSYYDLNTHELGTGSSFVESYKYLNMGISPVKEEIWGSFDTSSRTRSISEVLNYDNVDYQVSSYVVYGDNIYNKSNYSDSFKAQFMNKLKAHITEYGSLYVVTISPDSYAGSCYNRSKNLINYDENNADCKNGGYHAMSLVGWDDNYEGGSWILKNSWGNVLPYVYMSYNSDFFDISGVTKVDAKNWDNGYNFTKSNTSNYEIDSYTVEYYKSPEFKENLEKINFVSWGINATYNVYVKNGNGSYNLLDTVTTLLPGLVTLDVGNMVLDKSSFSIKVTTTDGFIDGGLNAFTSDITSEKYLETYEFTNTTGHLKKQLIVRGIPSGTSLNYYIFDEYGKKYNSDSTAYVVNGTVDVDYELPTLPEGTYYLTLDDNFFDVNTTREVSLKVGNTYQIEYEIGGNLNVRSVSYQILNSSILSVSDNGILTALKSGKTTVNLIINEGIVIPIEVTVFKDSNVDYLKIFENDQTIYLNLMNSIDLHLDMKPTTYGFSDVDWESNNPTVATVENGVVSFLGSGDVIITASSDDLTDSIKFNVINSTSNVTLSVEKTTIEVGEEITLTHNSSPFRYRYSTSDDEILKVRNGVVTGLKNGSAWVYYKRGNDVAGILINVIDSTKEMNLMIDPNNGKYEGSSEIVNKTGNSLSTINISNPVYSVRVTLVNGEETENIDIEHEFRGFNLLGYGKLNENNYTFGFGDGSLTALWNYRTYNLPILEDEKMNFIGWYKDPEFNEFFGKNISFVPKENITLYARFEEGIIGDINNDSEIDITDLVILGRYLVGLEEIDDKLLSLADINKDSEIDITDLVILGRYLVGLEEIN